MIPRWLLTFVFIASAAFAATVPSGTKINVVVQDYLSCDNNSRGDTFHAELKDDVVVNGKVVFPRGTWVTGNVVGVQGTNQLRRPGNIEVELTAFRTEERDYPMKTSTVLRAGMGNESQQQVQRKRAAMDAASDTVRNVITGRPSEAPGSDDSGVSGGGGVQAIITPGTELRFKLRSAVQVKDPPAARQ